MTNIDLIDVITHDHRAVETLLHEIETSPASPEHRRALADHVITELVRLVLSEQRFLYPAAGEFLPDGTRTAERARADHAEMDRLMAELENLSPADAKFELLLSSLTAAVRKHHHEVLSDLLPELRKACPAQKRRELGEEVLRVKQIAPTRPHPANADRPPAALVVDPGVPLIESVKSAVESALSRQS